MANAIEELRESLLAQVVNAASSAALEEVRVSALGRKGAITEQMKSLGKMAPDERKAAGQAFNALKDEVAAALEARKAGLEAVELEARLAREHVGPLLHHQGRAAEGDVLGLRVGGQQGDEWGGELALQGALALEP